MPSAKRPVMSRRSSSYSSYISGYISSYISSYSSCISSISSYSSSYSNWARSIRRRCWSGAYQGDHAAVAECPTVVSGRSRETSVTFGWLPDHTHPYQINNATQRELVRQLQRTHASSSNRCVETNFQRCDETNTRCARTRAMNLMRLIRGTCRISCV